MKKKKYFWSLMTLLLMGMGLSSGACTDKDDPDEVAVGQSMVNIGASGGSQSINIMSNTSWQINGAQSWVQVSPMSGSDNGSININVSQNTGEARNCQLTVQAGKATATITIIQEKGVPPTPNSLADRVAGTYVGKLTYGSEVLEDAYPITVEKLSDTAVKVTAAFFNTPQNFNLTENGNQIDFSNSTLSNIKMYVTGNTMNVNYLSTGGYMLSYTGVK